MSANFIITDDDGQPVGSIDLDAIETAATLLMYRMAVFCDDPDALDEIAADTLTAEGVDGFGYIAAAALRMLTRNVLAPTLEVTDLVGVDLRAGLRAALANAEATLGGDPR